MKRLYAITIAIKPLLLLTSCGSSSATPSQNSVLNSISNSQGKEKGEETNVEKENKPYTLQERVDKANVYAKTKKGGGSQGSNAQRMDSMPVAGK